MQCREDQHEVTQILRDWSNGDKQAVERLMPYVYDEMRRLASVYISREGHEITLQPTALVHEAYLRLIDQTRVSWQNRAHFYGVAASMMRRILIDKARAKASAKRGGAAMRLSLDDVQVSLPQRAADLVALDEALDRLAALDERKSRIVEMRFFGGMTDKDIASYLDISMRTVGREWKKAKLWLYSDLSSETD